MLEEFEWLRFDTLRFGAVFRRQVLDLPDIEVALSQFACMRKGSVLVLMYVGAKRSCLLGRVLAIGQRAFVELLRTPL
ncbi:hypothetical protein AWB76_04804 [Caballeronia temeraria]|uniref:Uncharacterized protein n=1 Tax=Caballeronia temeraria TaxID=1777137 RepID=A0A158BWX6_9BURK|nr:hypothetical protein [Caballeronia temeraria]SAK74619.1 hypothetical protein AWB76_04804 [Caballeronia temeraria]